MILSRLCNLKSMIDPEPNWIFFLLRNSSFFPFDYFCTWYLNLHISLFSFPCRSNKLIAYLCSEFNCLYFINTKLINLRENGFHSPFFVLIFIAALYLISNIYFALLFWNYVLQQNIIQKNRTSYSAPGWISGNSVTRLSPRSKTNTLSKSDT